VLDINAVQALLLFNIGDNEVTAGELKSRGYYQGSNVSYNLKRFVSYDNKGEAIKQTSRLLATIFTASRGPHGGEPLEGLRIYLHTDC
jgi:hypothetical protein